MDVRLCVLSLLLLAITGQHVFAQEPPSPASFTASGSPWLYSAVEAIHMAVAQAELKGKWIVRSVSRDGEPNPAQVGQEIEN